MLKRVALAAALFATSAWAQQELALTAKEIESGEADAKLAEIGRQAAASGKEVIVNAPKDWHQQIAAKIRAGGGEVKLNDSFFENVVVRVADKAAPKPVEPPAPAPAPKPEPVAPPPKPVAAPTPKPVAPPPPPKPEPKPEPVAPVQAPRPQPVESTPPPTPEPTPAPEPVAPPPAPPKPVEAPKPPPVAAAPAKPAVDPAVAIRQRFERDLNEGKAAEGELSPEQLEKDDVLYVDGPVVAVVRRARLHARLFWLNSEINLQRAELKPIAENRYQVLEKPTKGETLSLRTEVEGSQSVAAQVPADGDAERAQLEKAYSEGRPITRTLRTDQLQQGDLLYVGSKAAVVVRRDGIDLVRYWLDGTIDLKQRGVQKDGESKYKILSDTVK